MHEVVLFSKRDCPLCEHAKAEIRAARSRIEFAYREVDIEADPAIFETHRYDIPVVEVDGRRAFKHRLTAEALVARLSR
jgi:glutaredoxin